MRKILFCILLLTALACNLIVPPVTSVPSTSIPDAPFCQPNHSINEDANGQTIRLNKGDLLRVELDQNASTGYEWLVDRIQPEKLTDKGTDYSYAANLPPGSGGTQLLCFQAVNRGTTILRLIYRQPWLADATPDVYGPPDFEIIIVINE
ncbi:MAG: protease inhibitor I42 family protein [Anaerolineales bacterium]